MRAIGQQNLGNEKMEIQVEEKPLRLKGVMELVQMSRSWIYKEMALGNFPTPAYRFGKNSVAWSSRSVLGWLASKRI